MTKVKNGETLPVISIIMCMRNSEEFLKECLDSIGKQTYKGPIELSIFDDGSSDSSARILEDWEAEIKEANLDRNITVVKSKNEDLDNAKGVGYGKNRSIEQSSGEYLCFMDSDDVMREERLVEQLAVIQEHPNAIVGSKIVRIPEDSTPRYTNWTNSLNPIQVRRQIFTCFGPTIIMPTWFCTRERFFKSSEDGFDQSQARGLPEDLLFFYKHIRSGGDVLRTESTLLEYRYHVNATTFSVTDETIWKIRLKELEERILSNWKTFTIWNAGKEGRRLYRSLSEDNRKKVIAMADVDPKKISKKFYTYEESKEIRKPKVPIIHFSELEKPVIVCVKLGLYNGNFERNLDSLNLIEGIDFVHFG